MPPNHRSRHVPRPALPPVQTALLLRRDGVGQAVGQLVVILAIVADVVVPCGLNGPVGEDRLSPLLRPARRCRMRRMRKKM
eukprot:1948972-Pyramimonas_sp.AAC.1